MLRKLRDLPHRDSIGYVMILPFYVLFFVFVLLPILFNVVLSFCNFNLKSISFVGLQNYTNLFKDPLFLKSMGNTGVYVFFTVTLTLVLSFALALMLNHSSWLMKVFRAVFYLPNVISMVAVATVWQFMYNPYFGIFNGILKSLGLPTQTWVADVNLAMGCVVVMSIWKSAGYNMVLFLAGLQGVSHEIYESAAMDGAHGWKLVWHITLPSIRPVLFFVFITCCIGSFSVFEQVQVLTKGGPMYATTTIVHQIYTRAFTEFRLGYASAMSIVLAAIVFVFTVLSFRASRQDEQAE